MSRLHIFDMDGTLLRGAASVELSRYLGKFDLANAVEEAWVRGEITDIEFLDRVLPLWEGISEEQIDQAFEASPWIDGVAEVMADIAVRGEYSTVISQSPRFFVERLIRWGVGSAHGAGVVPGGRSGHDLLLTAEDKVTIADVLMADYGLTAAECVAYGDSTSDVLLFQRLPHTVAVNGNAKIRGLAAVSYEGTDLREAYAAGRALFESANGAGAGGSPLRRQQARS
ncbi:HAD family hydrolase [Pseudonocardia bannensis]|uniref:HAD-IB family phosphatase n=1 Tax=Pseudonocardia bannensis TaxID=630973 RepID=A0A848DGN3_9PSEU|nr:HAD-IB family phosphatase [Pseudonocardia bannensis]NMH91830.1 HAD-IB family phosphatase [Pseudonocardia bannensis]